LYKIVSTGQLTMSCNVTPKYLQPKGITCSWK